MHCCGRADAYAARYCLLCVAETLCRMARAALAENVRACRCMSGGVISSKVVPGLCNRSPAGRPVGARPFAAITPWRSGAGCRRRSALAEYVNITTLNRLAKQAWPVSRSAI